jgi:hypothetical protein
VRARFQSSCLAGVAVAFVVTAPSVARAQAGTPQAQFDYGLAEMEAGRFATGCPALAESYRLDPHPGVLFTLAECENKWGKLASALTHYEAYVDLYARMRDDERAHQRGRDRVAAAQRDRLRGEVPQLAVALPSGAPPGTTVTRDGVPLGAPSLGIAIPVDPGEHVVAARTPDGVSHEMHVTVARAEHRAIVVDLRAPAAAPPPASAPAPSPAPTPRSLAWITAGVGLAGLTVGAVAGALVLGDKSTISSSCNPDKTCSPGGLDAASHAHAFGLVSDVGFAVGGAGVLASAILFIVSSPRAVHPIAVADPHGGFVGLHATW